MIEYTGFDITGTIYEGANTHVFRAVKADNNQRDAREPGLPLGKHLRSRGYPGESFNLGSVQGGI